MQAPAARRHDPGVEGLAGKRMDEAHALAIRGGLQQMAGYRSLDNRQQGLIIEIGHLRPDRERHLLPDHGGHRQRLPCLLAKPGHATLNDVT